MMFEIDSDDTVEERVRKRANAPGGGTAGEKAVAERGEVWNTPVDYGPFIAPPEAPASGRETTEHFVEIQSPTPTTCFADARAFAQYEPDAYYVEGFVLDKSGVLIEHAWNEVGGTWVDVTYAATPGPPPEGYFGIVFDDEDLEAYGTERGGVLGNRKTSREWLKDHGYLRRTKSE